MVVSASAFRDITNGYERQTSGLWLHRGKFSVGPPGTAPTTAGDINAHRGDGTGAYYFGGLSNKYLYFNGTGFVLQGGPLTFTPASGTITRDSIQPNAAQEQIGSYAQLVSWTLGTSSVWTETPVQLSLQFSGAKARIEFNVLLGCPTKGQRIFYAIMVDGSSPASGVALGALDAPEANYAMMASGTHYWTPAPGVRRFAFGVYGPAGAQISSVIASTMYVTEQER